MYNHRRYVIGSTLSHFRITAKLGEGGMGEVYRANDTKLGRDVAIKVLPEAVAQDPERLARFEREAKVLASLNHPHIAGIHQVEDADGVHFLVMELVEGEDLKERLDRGPVALETALPLALQITEALEVAHEKGIVHRDLKPANIKVTPEGQVKVLDFGLAKALDPSAGAETGRFSSDPAGVALPGPSLSPTLTAQMTQAGVLLGTAAYMAPEQARGQEADKRADIWAFGVVLMEMLSGGSVYSGDTVSDTLAGILAREPDWDKLPGDTPRNIRRLLDRCLEKDSSNRLRDIGEARIAINDYLANGDEPAREAVPSEAESRPASSAKRALPWIAALAACLAAIGFGVAYFGSRGAPAPLINASITVPVGLHLVPAGYTAGPAVVSPDGRRLAFSAVDDEGNQSLWHRALDQSEATPLPGTEGALRPFWSPDSQNIGFFANSNLKRISVVGGPPITIAGVSDPRGGSWGSQGQIVYAPNLGGPIMSIPEGGGNPRQVTTLDPDRNEQTHRYPSFLPDGKHILYLARSTSGGAGIEPYILVENIDSGERKFLIEVASDAAYASGHLLYMRHTTLFAQPFDLETLEIVGDPVPLMESVLYDSQFTRGTFSASDNGVLVFHPGGNFNMASTPNWLDRDGNTLEAMGAPMTYQSVKISPDGETAAVTISDSTSGNDEIWLLDLSRGLPTRFTFGGSTHSESGYALWSPDARTIVYGNNQSGTFDLYRKPVSGSGSAELIAASDHDLWAYDWSADGEWVCYGMSLTSGEDLFVLSMTGATDKPVPVLTTPFNEWPCTFSPDGRWLAYVSDESGLRQVYVSSFPDLEGKWQVSSDGGDFPRWRGDSREIYFLSPTGQLRVAAIEDSTEGFRVSEEKSLFTFRPLMAGDFTFDVARDGSRFLVLLPEDQLASSRLSLILNWPEKISGR